MNNADGQRDQQPALVPNQKAASIRKEKEFAVQKMSSQLTG